MLKSNIAPLLKLAAVFVALAAVGGVSPVRAEFTVHEWGTFTVLHGSDGQALRWYQPYQDQNSLPPFVHRAPRGKGSDNGGVIARMETPVLYFYPEQKMNISVYVSLPAGSLSEWFPNGPAANTATHG